MSLSMTRATKRRRTPLSCLGTRRVAQALSSEYGRRVDVSPINNDAFKAELADATMKFLVPTPAGHAGFMLMSGEASPSLVSRAVHNIRIARDSVSARTGALILPPVATGTVEGRTFAVWPMKRPFLASTRVMQRLNGLSYAKTISRWVASLCHETLVPATAETVLGDLNVIVEDSAFSNEIRRAAEHAAGRVCAGQWQPMHCLHHGDLWSGNLLLPTYWDVPSFYVIDWAGMQRQGYPFLDLARMLMSLRCDAQFNAGCITNLRAHIGCDKDAVVGYILSACGRLGANLEHFPPDRFRTATRDLYEFVKTA